MHDHGHEVRMPDLRENAPPVKWTDCVLCDITMMDNPVHTLCSPGELFTTAYMSVPRDPVKPGHIITWPRTHFARMDEEPFLTGEFFKAVSQFAANSEWMNYNIIVNNGSEAGQTIHHLHVHLIPRNEDDGIVMPWTHQKIDVEAPDYEWVEGEPTLEWVEDFTCTCTHDLSEHNRPMSLKRGCMKRGCKCPAEVQWVNHTNEKG